MSENNTIEQKRFYEVKRSYEKREYNDYNDYTYTCFDSLGIFSSVENAWKFIQGRITSHYGVFTDYSISMVEVDIMHLKPNHHEVESKKIIESIIEKNQKEGEPNA